MRSLRRVAHLTTPARAWLECQEPSTDGTAADRTRLVACRGRKELILTIHSQACAAGSLNMCPGAARRIID